MNTLIQQLAVQSGLNLELQSLKVEKFAELLIKECAYIVENSPWRLDRGYKAVDQANLVKEHFGVK